MKALVFLLVLSTTAFGQHASNTCEAGAETRRILDRLAVPSDVRQTAAQIRDAQLLELRRALQASPRDIFLHSRHQDVKIGRYGYGRNEVIEEYQAFLNQHPSDPIYLYLAARAQFSRNTARAIGELEQSLSISPQFGAPHLLLAEIYLAPSFQDLEKVRVHLQKFNALCPSSVAAFPSLRWSTDKETVMMFGRHLRATLADRTGREALAAYPMLWGMELALQRSDRQEAFREQVMKDLQRIWGKEFPRNIEWLRAVEQACDIVHENAVAGYEEMATLYPNSDLPAQAAMERWTEQHGFPLPSASKEEQHSYHVRRIQALAEIAQRWPAVPRSPSRIGTTLRMTTHFLLMK